MTFHHRTMTRAVLSLVLLAAGCAKPAGIVFAPRADAPQWPGPPEPPRIRYVGELATSADLKPAVPFGRALGQALFGKQPAHSMLSPYGVCTDDADRLFVADSNAQCLHVFNLKDRTYQQWRPGTRRQPASFAQPVAVVYHRAAGQVLVADSAGGVLYKFDLRGNYLGSFAERSLERPVAIAIHADTGRLYVADAAAHQVVVLGLDGEEIVRIGKRGTAPGEFNFPTAIAFDRQGRLYVSDTLNFRVQQIAPDMTTIRIIGSKGDLPGYFAQPRSLAVNSADHLYVVDNQFEAVQIFDSQGRLLLDFGQEGRGPGQFWLPAGIHIDARDRIWVADSYNRRVQVFDYLAEVKP